MKMTPQELEAVYDKPDPWGYQTNPADIERKRFILDVVNRYGPYVNAQEILDSLGKLPDTEIAKKANVSKYAIAGERKRRGILPFPCQTKFKKGDLHPRWHKRKGV